MAELDPAAGSWAEVKVGNESGTPVLGLSGDLDLTNAEQVRSSIEAVLAGGAQRVVFDTSGLEFVDSSGIALLVSIAQRVREVELRHPSAIVRRLIELTGLEETLRLVP